MKGKAAETFEELHMYQRARELCRAVYALTRKAPFHTDFGLVDQIRRASVSIMSNIAEGFEHGTTPRFIEYLYISKGSCGEVRAQLQVAADQEYVDLQTFERLGDDCRRLSGMISNFIAHLQSSGYAGEKFTRPLRLAAQTSQEWQVALRAAQLANIRPAQPASPDASP